MAIEVDVEADVARVVRSSVTVKLPRDAAFRLFTERMGSWWPLATHSVFHAEAVAVTIEPVVGGRVYEATADGRTSDWGTITEWQPGERLAMTWHPGEESDLATLVEVTFSEAPDGGTHVDLLHTGWAVHGAEAAARAADYQQGWTALLEGFAKASPSTKRSSFGGEEFVRVRLRLGGGSSRRLQAEAAPGGLPRHGCIGDGAAVVLVVE